MSSPTNTVCILQEGIPDYRRDFFRALETSLSSCGIRLRVLAGDVLPGLAFVDALDEVPCARRLRRRAFGRGTYTLSPVWTEVRQSSLVILPHTLAMLSIYPLLLARKARLLLRVAFWGHGDNLQRLTPQPVRSAVRNTLARGADWWFAYTSLSREILLRIGIPPDRITVVQNAIDTRGLLAAAQHAEPSALAALRRQLFPGDAASGSYGAPGFTGVYCGRFVRFKWIPFLLDSIHRIHEQLPAFRMVLVGDGPERAVVESFCRQNPWCAWVGGRHGKDRVQYLALGDVMLNPGMVGLNILDAFAMGLPMITAANRIHSPEIAYLADGDNGLVTPPAETDYATAVVGLFRDPARLARLKGSARSTAAQYTLEAMVSRFSSGILQCLQASHE